MTEDLARKRFFLLTMLRFGGVVLAFVGIAVIAKRWIEPAETIGGVLLVAAIVGVVVAPPVLIRRWRREE